MNNKSNTLFFLSILIFAFAIFYMLDMFGIDFRDFIVLTAGVAGMIYAYKTNSKVLKYVSLFLLTQGIMLLIATFLKIRFTDYIYIGLILFLIGCCFISKKKIVALISVIAISAYVVNLINLTELSSNIRTGYYFYCFTILSVVFFVLNSKKIGYKPLFVSLILYLFGTNNMLLGNNIISTNGFKLINLALLVISGICVYIISKIANSEEN